MECRNSCLINSTEFAANEGPNLAAPRVTLFVNNSIKAEKRNK